MPTLFEYLIKVENKGSSTVLFASHLLFFTAAHHHFLSLSE